MGALCVASTKAAVIPVEEIVDGLQSFLTAPEESGLRLKRSTGDWDKEFDLSSMGVLFQLKYTNPANPFEGGRAHVKVPGARFVRNAPFDDMEMDIEFNGGSAIDGLFDMKVDYKFIQKFMFLADRPQEGSFVLYRKMEGGMWKSKVTIDNNNRMPKPFLDIEVESDRKTKLHVLFNFEEDNKWELKVDRVPGQKMTIEAVVNGQKWTGVGTLNQGDMKLNLKMDSEFMGKHFNVDFDLNPAGMWGLHVTGDVDGPVDAKWTMQKDFTMGEISIKYKNQNYAFMQLKGNAEKRGMFPIMFDYVVKYNINDAEQHQGKAKLKFDARTPAKRFEINYAPKTGTPFEYAFDFDLSSGFKYDSDLKVNGALVEKATGDFTWVNNANKFEIKSDETFTQTKENPFYNFNTMYLFGGRYVEKMEKSRNFFFDKVQKAQLLNKMKIEEDVTLDGQTWYHIKYDKYDGEYSWVNNANKFEVKSNEKVNQEQNGPYYGMDYWFVGTYWKDAVVTRTFTYEKQNRNFLLGKIFFESKVVADGERFYEAKLDTRATPYTMVWFHKPVRAFYPTPRDVVGQDEMTVSAWHTPGKELKFETNLPEFRTMKVTSAGPTKTFWFNGEEKATVDFDSSSKKASHTMHLPSGKDLTITPDRKVVTKFGWEWAGVNKVYLDVVGNNPWIGDYKMSRQGEFELVSGSVYKIKWTGHGETAKGFLHRVSPVETHVVSSVNMKNMKVDAIVWKSFAGKKYGFTLTNDKFNLLAGQH